MISHRTLSLIALTAVTLGWAVVGIDAQTAHIGDFDGHGDIGSPKLTGTAAYNPVSQDYVLTAGGTNMWAQRDEFHFVWKRMTGDFILQTRVELIGKGVEPHRKAGLMIRAGQDAEAPYADGVIHGDGLTSLQFRRTKGAITEERRPEIKGADVLQLERRGNTFIFSAAKFGDPFVDDGDPGPRARRRGAGRARAVFAQPRRDRTCRVQQRSHHPAGEGRVRAVPRLHRQRARAARRAERPAAGDSQGRAPVRGAELDAGRKRSHLQRQRPRREPRQALSLRSHDPSAGRDRHRHIESQQQRSRALVRRHDAGHQRPERGSIGYLHAASCRPARRSASARRRAAARPNGSRR